MQMMRIATPLARRKFLAASAAVLLPAVCAAPAHAVTAPASLTAASGKWPLVGGQAPPAAVWAYDETIPGPVLRYRQGDMLTVRLQNNLPQSSTIHWHGLRVPHAMDGVPWLTQPPVKQGDMFDYRFPLADAGTYWYHPHVNSAEQIGRGLAGAIVITHPDDPAVDADLVWQLDDWRLLESGALAPFHNRHDASHGGRIGNTVTLNGRIPDRIPVTAGHRMRLRLINTANARIFGLRFNAGNVWLFAVDGHPVQPLALKDGQLAIPPGGRADLVIDITAAPGDEITVTDDYYQRAAYRLCTLVSNGSPEDAITAGRRPPPARLPANPVAAPDFTNAIDDEVRFGGGAMSRMTGGRIRGVPADLQTMVENGLFWTINGQAMKAGDHAPLEPPLWTVKRGQTVRMRWHNDSAFPHPMHMHGHSFFVLARNGHTAPEPVLHDTVLVSPRGHADVAFVADNPGLWMFHCHIPEHQHAGMMGIFLVDD